MLYRFGEFEVDDATRQVLAQGVSVHLSPKAFDLLAFLLANRTRAVSKVELQERLWPATFVEETNIASLIAEVRRALHDPAARPELIGTVYGYGYRFVGGVTVDEQKAPATTGRTQLYLLFDARELLLMNGDNMIGRADDATVQLDSPGVSRYHARVRVADAGATLEDNQSKNGTYLNGQRIADACVLKDGDEIRVGSVAMTFRIAAADMPTVTLPG